MDTGSLQVLENWELFPKIATDFSRASNAHRTSTDLQFEHVLHDIAEVVEVVEVGEVVNMAHDLKYDIV